MRKLVEQFVKYPILANIVIAITLMAGALTLWKTNKSMFPTTEPRNISIQVVMPGASPEEMEEGVTLKIEEAIHNISGIEEITSTSSENVASINVLTLTGYDIEEVYTEVKNAVDGISSFPTSAERPMIFKQKPTSPAQWIGITGNVDKMTLKRFAEDIKDDFLTSGLISQVQVMGVNPIEISVNVSEQDLLRYNLTFDQVANAVRINNRDISAGSIKTSREEILIRSRAKETEADKLGDIILRANADGSKIYLRDVAHVEERFSEDPSHMTLNGEDAVFLRVDKLEEEDLTAISDYVQEYIKEFNEKHDAVKMNLTFNFMGMLQQRLDMLLENAGVGVLLVLICLGFFLSLRLSFWVAWGIPSSFLGLFIIGSFFGLTINMISLFGMIVVIGILVDDGIVIAENIYSHFEKHGNPIKAAIEGTVEVIPAVTTSVLTTVIAFSPLLLLSGGMEFLSDMAFVVIACLLFSLLEAFFVLPSHLASPSVLKVKSKSSKGFHFRNKTNQFIDFMRYKLYGRALKLTLKYKAISVALLIGLFPIVFGLLSGGIIKSTMFPNIPFSQINLGIAFKPGTRETKVEEYLSRFEKAVWEVNQELKTKHNDTTDYIRFSLSFVGSNNAGENGSHAGSLIIFHRELDETPVASNLELTKLIREKIGDVPEAEKFSLGGRSRFGSPVSVMLLGKDSKELDQAKEWLKNELATLPMLTEIQDNVPVGKREIQLDLKPEAYFLGFNHFELTKQIRQGFFGEEVQRLQKGDDEVRIWVRYPGSGRLNIGQLEGMRIKTVDGKEYPLTQLADYSIERGVSGIRHYNTSKAITVEAEMVDPEEPVTPVTEKVQNEIVPELLAKFPSVKVDYGGQSKESARSQQEFAIYLIASLILIFFVIMLNFKSFYQAVLVIAMVPLGILGGIIGHGVEGIPVSMLSAWGLLALSGVIINDSVVFLDKYNRNLKEGMTVYDAVFDAGIARFRPIMLTSITTVAGLYPLILETSFQAQFLIPMAVSVAYGVMIGTAIILLFFPVLIVVFNDVRKYAKWLWEGQKPEAEEVERVLIDEKRIEQFENTLK
jgi:multidrug efflux pump subunit AcrB